MIEINSNKKNFFVEAFKRRWIFFWMRFAGISTFGRFATRLVTLFGPPHKASYKLAKMNPKGYIAPGATIYHSNLKLGKNVLIGDRVMIYQAKDGGPIILGDRVSILRDSTLETGLNGSLVIGDDTWIQPRCQINAYMGSIKIGKGVDIAPNCALYSYNHGTSLDRPIREQPIETRGGIVIGDNAWLGVGVIVLDGVTIGEGAVIGAGSVVTTDVPDNAVVAGVPARFIRFRDEYNQFK